MKHILFVSTLALLTAAVSWAGVDTSTNSDGVILNGYDAVAYFTEGKPVPGQSQFTAEHDGATFQFSTAANRDAFVATPGKFAPAYGGFCAYGTALGKKFAVDGQAFEIVEGVLYVNKNLKVYKTWSKDIPGNVSKANQEWPKIQNVPAGDL